MSKLQLFLYVYAVDSIYVQLQVVAVAVPLRSTLQRHK